jgi:AcrR family transcriptional regulator
MDVAHCVTDSLKLLLETIPLGKITISDICAQAHISRRTFYKHFKDKNEIIEQIIASDVAQPIEEFRKLVNTIEMKSAGKFVVELMYKKVYENRAFYFLLFRHGGRLIFENTTRIELIKVNAKVLANKDLTQLDKEYMGYFFSAAQAMLMAKWIEDAMRVTPKQLANYWFLWAQKGMDMAIGDDVHW